jgi:integrase
VSNITGMSYKIPAPVKIGFDNKVIPSTSKDRVKYWRVTIGATQTAEGKKVRRFFDTEKDAKAWIGKMEEEIAQRGKDAFNIPDGLRHEALQCWKRLRPFDATITQAVDYFLLHSRPDGGKKRFKEVAQEFLSSRITANCKPRTVDNYRSFVNVANERWSEELINEIKLPEIESWVTDGEWEPRTRRNYLASMTAVLGFAMDRKYCADNPAKKASRPRLQEKEIEILTPEEARTFLAACQQFSPDMVAGVAIGLFAGLRASELCSLDWAQIDLAERCIIVTGAKAKTRQRRVVAISDNLLAWLTPLYQKRGPVLAMTDDPSRHISSGLLGFRRANMLKALAEYREEMGLPSILTNWPNNGMRHSFGSYYYSKTKDADKTAAEMGNSAGMVFGHYRAVVKPKATEEYWNILPAGEAVNILPMVAA